MEEHIYWEDSFSNWRVEPSLSFSISCSSRLVKRQAMSANEQTETSDVQDAKVRQNEKVNFLIWLVFLLQCVRSRLTSVVSSLTRIARTNKSVKRTRLLLNCSRNLVAFSLFKRAIPEKVKMEEVPANIVLNRTKRTH